MVIQGIRLHQVNDIESILLACSCVGDFEVVPLCVASCVVVWLEYQIIFVLVNLDGSAQVG